MSRTSEPHSIVAWVFFHELSGCAFEPSCSHLNFSFFNGFCSAVPQKGTNVDKFVCPMLSMQKGCLKLVSAIFIKFYFFHQMTALQKLWKMLFISSKKLFSFKVHFCPSLFSTCRPLLWRTIEDKSWSSWRHLLCK